MVYFTFTIIPIPDILAPKAYASKLHWKKKRSKCFRRNLNPLALGNLNILWQVNNCQEFSVNLTGSMNFFSLELDLFDVQDLEYATP